MAFAEKKTSLEYSSLSLKMNIENFRQANGYIKIPDIVPDGLGFLEWCEELAENGLEVDGHPFNLKNRHALKAIYDAVPSTKEEGYNKSMVVMKGAQTGLTVLSFLLQIYIAAKYTPVKVGIYYPDRSLAGYVSSSRFMPVVRSIPIVHKALLDASGGKEGNVLTRQIGKSEIIFLWTSGSSATESFPLGAIIADEVQNMMVDDIERIKERMSASDIRFFFALSTAKWPDSDIDYWYKRGTKQRFHTNCECSGGIILDEFFPACIRFNVDEFKQAPKNTYVYACPHCETYIPDSQDGVWIAENPDAEIVSYHFPQTLSPTVSPGEMIDAYNNAQDMQNFFNRKLGKPYADPSQIPISLDIMNQCGKDGMAAGIIWKQSAKGTYMGIDQMGAYNVVIIKERMEDGRQAVVHVEAIYNNDPFVRCSEMMKQYGVVVCVVETLPNYNDAKRFSHRHKGKVFLASYKSIEDDMLQWGDANFNKADRKTDEAERDRYTVSLDQYKCMQTSMAKFVKRQCVFPDPNALTQDVLVKGIKKKIAICKDEVFVHFTKTALVAEKDEEQNKYKRKVVKVGIDPHFSYANMLCDVAWARAHGTSHFIMPEAEKLSDTREKAEQAMPGLDNKILNMMESLPAGDVCGRCSGFDPEKHYCNERNFGVRPKDTGCMFFISGED